MRIAVSLILSLFYISLKAQTFKGEVPVYFHPDTASQKAKAGLASYLTTGHFQEYVYSYSLIPPVFLWLINYKPIANVDREYYTRWTLYRDANCSQAFEAKILKNKLQVTKVIYHYFLEFELETLANGQGFVLKPLRLRVEAPKSKLAQNAAGLVGYLPIVPKKAGSKGYEMKLVHRLHAKILQQDNAAEFEPAVRHYRNTQLALAEHRPFLMHPDSTASLSAENVKQAYAPDMFEKWPNYIGFYGIWFFNDSGEISITFRHQVLLAEPKEGTLMPIFYQELPK